MSTCTSTDSLQAASRCRRNTSGPNTAGSVTAPSARSRPRNAMLPSKASKQSLDSNHRCWSCRRRRFRDCIRIHTRLRLLSLNIAVLDLPLLPVPEQEGVLDSYWHFCPKAGSGDGLRRRLLRSRSSRHQHHHRQPVTARALFAVRYDQGAAEQLPSTLCPDLVVNDSTDPM